jgi:hypothetical protein
MTDSLDTFRFEPYRVFFPLGHILAILGLAVWIVDWIEQGLPHPGAGHAVLMLQGVAFSFALGMVLTEADRSLETMRRAAGNVAAILGLLAAITAEAFLLPRHPGLAWPILSAIHLANAGAVFWFLLRRAGRALPPHLASACIALHLIFFGLLLPIVFPVQAVAVSHFTYVAGFGWFILARATGYVPVRESFRLPMGGWRPVAICGSLLLAGGFLRMVADFAPDFRPALLALAAVFVMAPVLLWSWMTLPLVSPRSRGPLPSARG